MNRTLRRVDYRGLSGFENTRNTYHDAPAFRIFMRMEAIDSVDSWYESLFEQALHQNVLTRLF